ncbi:CHAP domain-containing protein [Lapidilactobacillus luobeiensis]|uniref:CHAP domain-containing protein n=1 Tax=Lapidilactobacillus luobeiensis TaxID=2950371 RepID=UPI0028527717|nr:CHAP domain-containing protein [Lapidilactobacillus luobeiensis]
MKKRTGQLIRVLTVVLLASSAVAQATTVSATTIDSERSQLAQGKSQKQNLAAQLETLQSKVWGYDKQVVAKNQAITQAEDAITASQKRLQVIATKIDTTTTKLKNRRSVLKEQLIQLQKQSTSSVSGNIYVDFIFSSDNLSELFSRTLTVGKLNQANQQAMAAVSESKAELVSLKDEQDQKQKGLVVNKAKLVTEKTALVKAQQQAQGAVTNLQTKIAANQDLLENLQVSLQTATAAQKAAAKKVVAQPLATTPNVNAGRPSVNHSGANPYAWGQCTWYAYQRSGWAGGHWGNGGQWGYSARAAGFTVNNTPAAGAIVSFGGGQLVGNWVAAPGYGHVAYVESYNAATGTITISQGGMGFGSPAGPNLQTIGNVGAYTYIHSPY